MKMTHKERAIAALTRQIPDHVPTFELEFQLAEEMFGKPLFPPELKPGRIETLSALEKEQKIYEMAEYTAYVYKELDYSIIPLMMVGDSDYWDKQGKLPPEFVQYARYLREFTEGKVLLAHHGDGTYSIPDGNDMYEFAYRIADDPEGVCEQAQKMADWAIDRNKKLHEAGIDVLLLCCDYCYNTGPFLSPDMFRQFIQPYLSSRICIRLFRQARRTASIPSSIRTATLCRSSTNSSNASRMRSIRSTRWRASTSARSSGLSATRCVSAATCTARPCRPAPRKMSLRARNTA